MNKVSIFAIFLGFTLFAQIVQANDDCILPKTQQAYDDIECLNKRGLARVVKIIKNKDYETGLVGLVNQDGNVLLPTEYTEISMPIGWDIGSSAENIDALIMVKYRKIQKDPLILGYFLDNSDIEYGFVDTTGKFIIPLGKYDFSNGFHEDSDGLAMVRKDDKWGFINATGNIVIPLDYDEALPFENDIARVKKVNKSGIINLANQAIIPFEYDEIRPLDSLTKNHFFEAKINDKSALINRNNQRLTKFEYDFISPIYDSDLFRVMKNRQLGVIDSTGKLIIPTQYRFIEDRLQSLDSHKIDLPQEYIEASANDITYYFDKNGKLIIKNSNIR